MIIRKLRIVGVLICKRHKRHNPDKHYKRHTTMAQAKGPTIYNLGPFTLSPFVALSDYPLFGVWVAPTSFSLRLLRYAPYSHLIKKHL